MLTLGMAFIGKPRLLMIDELSLGLAPAVVGQLLDVVRALRDDGTTIILVEQSVNVALTVADRAYFMEKGEVRFEGPTSELLERPDLLRSVFLRTAAAEVGDDDSHAASGLREGPPVLEVRDVTRRFGGVRALDRVSLDVRPGEILGFIGPNGAGKTTLFDAISGYTPADGGSIRLLSRGEMVDIHDKPTHARSWLGLGRSFQDGRLFPGLTVHEAIAVALEQHVEVRDPIAATLHLPFVKDSEEQVHTRVDELIELLALGAYRDKFVRELSTGTRRVVDLACVLAQGPSVLLLDEPSSGIAQREAEALAPMLRRVRDELGASLLVIEHDLPLLSSISDRMIALDLGRVVAEGSPDDLKARIGGDRIDVVVEAPDDVPAAAVAVGRATGAEVEVTPDDRRVSVPVADRMAALTAVVTALRDADVPAEDIAVRRPTLDEVFLHLTDRTDCTDLQEAPA
ncbi:MAG: ATP-binding cassette domain-containing protein, partial [Acidimicrobiales bacterium]|nr:ATP-binding cassette domain-containing protein [Acidimicrobiales bacterium]